MNPVGPIRAPYPVRTGGQPPISSPYPVAPFAPPIPSPIGNEQPPSVLGLPSGISRPVGGPPDVLGMPSGVSGAYPISGPPITFRMPGPMPVGGGPTFPGGNPGMQPIGSPMPNPVGQFPVQLPPGQGPMPPIARAPIGIGQPPRAQSRGPIPPFNNLAGLAQMLANKQKGNLMSETPTVAQAQLDQHYPVHQPETPRQDWDEFVGRTAARERDRPPVEHRTVDLANRTPEEQEFFKKVGIEAKAKEATDEKTDVKPEEVVMRSKHPKPRPQKQGKLESLKANKPKQNSPGPATITSSSEPAKNRISKES